MPLLQPPPRDANGAVIPHDHAEILPGHRVIRRIPENWIDRKGPKPRISSQAYKPSSGPNGGMSIDLEQSIIDAGLVPGEFVTNPRWVGAVIFNVGDLRNLGFRVGYDPLDENPHHGEVWGNFSRANQRSLSQICAWLIQIEGVDTQLP